MKHKVKRLGNIYGEQFSGSFAGNVYDVEAYAPTIITYPGGGVPFIKEEKMKNDKVKTLGNYSPSEHNASKIVDIEYSAPTVRENHGTVTAIVDDTYRNRSERVYEDASPSLRAGRSGLKVANKKAELADTLIEQGKVHENDVIRHSYTSSRMSGEFKDAKQNNICPTLDTRSDCLGVVNDLRIRKLTPRECFRLMGVKDEDVDKLTDLSNSTLYHLAGDSIVTTVLMAIFGELLEVEWKEKVNILHGN